MNSQYNLVGVSTATTGTGTITLGAAVAGYLNFAQGNVPDGAIVTYGIIDGANSAIEKGTYTASGTTLSRDTVYRSTGAGNNTKISLSGSAQIFITVAAEDLASLITKPQGRLTLTTATPVMSSDVAAAATIYYTPHVGDRCPIYDGASWQFPSFAETSLALDSNSGHTGYQASGSLFDIFAFFNAGVFTIGTGPAWTALTARGAGAGTTELQRLNGLWTNKNSITLRFGSVSGNTVSVAANCATYLGTMYATANGQTAMQFLPAIAAGGANPFLGLYNAHNRVLARSNSQDNTSSWTYATSTWRVADNSSSNRISWVDGLGESAAQAEYLVEAGMNSSNFVHTGVTFNSTTASPTPITETQNNNTSSIFVMIASKGFLTQLGLNSAYAMEWANGTITFFGGAGNSKMLLTLSVEM